MRIDDAVAEKIAGSAGLIALERGYEVDQAHQIRDIAAEAIHRAKGQDVDRAG